MSKSTPFLNTALIINAINPFVRIIFCIYRQACSKYNYHSIAENVLRQYKILSTGIPSQYLGSRQY